MIIRGLSILAGLCLLAMMSVAMIDALGRYFFSAPIRGASEIIAYLLGYTVFFALPAVTRERGHIEVGILVASLPKAARRAERVVTALMTVGGFAFVTWLMIGQGVRLHASGVLLANYELPSAPFIYPIVVLAGVTALGALGGFGRKPGGGDRS
jgi:TRAP-type C4-dicarboxylate transport system permease small subunit